MTEQRAGVLGAIISTLVGLLMLAISYGVWLAVLAKDDSGYGALYGLVVFLVVPMLQGAFTTVICRKLARNPEMSTLNWAAMSGALLPFALMFFALEGVICVMMAFPIWLALVYIGAAVSERGCGYWLGMGMLVPFAFVHDIGHEPTTQKVTTEVTIEAPASEVWPLLKDIDGYPAPTELLFRAGVAYPIGTRTVGTRRYCRMSTGDIEEQITQDVPNRLLTWRVTLMPDSMRETSPYGEIHPAHLKGIFVLHEGGFLLQPLPGGRTRLIGYTTYSNAMSPETYWDFWCRRVVSDVHLRVMTRIKTVAELAHESR